MARVKHKLTPERVKQKCKKVGVYADGGGLYLRVERAATSAQDAWASWLFRYALGWKVSKSGRRYPAGRAMGLGDCDLTNTKVSLDTARTMADRWRSVLAAGKDPIEVRDAERAAERLEAANTLPFKQCAEMYVDAHSPGWKNAKHVQQWRNTLATYAYPVIGDLSVVAVDTPRITKILDPIWNKKTETASRLRGRIESVLDWAKVRGYRAGENPARWKGHLENIFPARSKARKVKHHPALPHAEMPEFMESLKTRDGSGARALQLMIFTAARTAEIVAAHWDEFDLESGLWTVPEGRMKKEREHRVPLSKPALSILREQHKITGGADYVFPGLKPKRPLSNAAMSAVLKRMGRYDITVHGFRSTFRDWVEETTNYSGTVAEAALAHIVGDKTEAAYRRGDLFEKRRKLMAAWATYCTTPAKPGVVIPMKKTAVSPI